MERSIEAGPTIALILFAAKEGEASTWVASNQAVTSGEMCGYITERGHNLCSNSRALEKPLLGLCIYLL